MTQNAEYFIVWKEFKHKGRTIWAGEYAVSSAKLSNDPIRYCENMIEQMKIHYGEHDQYRVEAR